MTKSSRLSAHGNYNMFTINRANLYTDTLGGVPFNKDLNVIYKQGKKSMNMTDKND